MTAQIAALHAMRDAAAELANLIVFAEIVARVERMGGVHFGVFLTEPVTVEAVIDWDGETLADYFTDTDLTVGGTWQQVTDTVHATALSVDVDWAMAELDRLIVVAQAALDRAAADWGRHGDGGYDDRGSS